MNNWLEIVIGVFLLSMVLHGHYKGFIRLAVSMVAFIATLVIVNTAMPKVSVFLKENTPVMTWIEQGVEKAVGIGTEENTSLETELPAEQRMAIEGLKLPQEIKDLLIENNNNEVYRNLGVEAFTDYIGNYLANVFLNLIGFILLFLLVYFVLQLLMRWLDVVARLPVLSGINKLAGALLGGIQGLFYVWIACLFLTVFSGTSWAADVMSQVEASAWLSFLYHYNFISRLFFSIVQGILA